MKPKTTIAKNCPACIYNAIGKCPKECRDSDFCPLIAALPNADIIQVDEEAEERLFTYFEN